MIKVPANLDYMVLYLEKHRVVFRLGISSISMSMEGRDNPEKGTSTGFIYVEILSISKNGAFS